MDQILTSSNAEAWSLSRLGYAIDVLVDRKLNDPQAISDHSAAYGIDGNGNMYEVGKPTSVQTINPVNGTISPMFLLMVIGVVLLVKK
jgi:hypothetical protein